MSITPIQASTGLGASQQVTGLQQSSMGSTDRFGDALVNALRSTNEDIVAADTAAQNLVEGQGGNLHETMIAIEKADISMRFTMRIAQKLVQAYQEVSRMQL